MAQFPEGITRRYLGHSGCRRIGHSQRPPGQMHAPQPKISCRTHPEMLMAEYAKRAVRYGGRCAEVRQVQSPVGVRLEEIFQPPHHSRVPPVRTANLDPLALAQALDHYPDQRLL